MAIVKPPKTAADKKAEALIDRAAHVSSDGRKGKEIPVTVRIPQGMLDEIERLVSARPIKTARHTWLMEAIYEKLQRDTTGRKSR